MPTTQLDAVIAALELCGSRPKKKGNEWYAKCPVHGGHDFDSLSLREGTSGKVLIRCHSRSCEYHDIMGVLGLDNGTTTEDTTKHPPSTTKRISATYDYRDEAGVLLFQVLRYDTPQGKTFRQRMPQPDGGWSWSVKQARKVLYNLPVLISAIADGRIVFVVEGEKDVDRLAEYNLVGTCNPGGADKWQESYSDTLVNARVVILPDNDDAGRKHAEAVVNAITGKATTVRVLELPGLPEGGDVSNWFDADNSAATLIDLVKAVGRLPVLSMHDFMNFPVEPRQWVLSPILKQGDMAIIHSWRGAGKTQLSMGIALAVAAGGSVLKWNAPEPSSVIYVEGEMTIDELQSRLRKQGSGINLNEQQLRDMVSNLHFIQHDVVARSGYRMKRLSTSSGLAELECAIMDTAEALATPVRLLILDNLSCLHGGEENESGTWEEYKEFLIRMRRLGIAGITVHHSGKSGTSRGHSSLEDQLDVVLKLDSKKYQDAEGAKFDVRFEKARGITGEATTTFGAWLRDDDEGTTSRWSVVTEIRNLDVVSKAAHITRLRSEGWSFDNIARELRMAKRTVIKLAAEKNGDG